MNSNAALVSSYSHDLEYIKSEHAKVSASLIDAMNHARNIGERLSQIKSEVNHGSYTALVRASGFDERTARDYVSVYQKWSELEREELLGYSPGYALKKLREKTQPATPPRLRQTPARAPEPAPAPEPTPELASEASMVLPRGLHIDSEGYLLTSSGHRCRRAPGYENVPPTGFERPQPASEQTIDVQAHAPAQEYELSALQPELQAVEAAAPAEYKPVSPEQIAALEMYINHRRVEPDDRDAQIAQLQQQLSKAQERIQDLEDDLQKAEVFYRNQYEALDSDYQRVVRCLDILKNQNGLDEFELVLGRALDWVEELKVEKASLEAVVSLKSYWEKLGEQPINAERSSNKALPQTDIKLYAWVVQLIIELLEPPSIVASYLDMVDSILNQQIEIANARIEEVTKDTYQMIERKWQVATMYKSATSTYDLSLEELERLRFKLFNADHEYGLAQLRWQLKSEKEYSQRLLKSAETFYQNRLTENHQRQLIKDYREAQRALGVARNPRYADGSPAPVPEQIISTLQHFAVKFPAPSNSIAS